MIMKFITGLLIYVTFYKNTTLRKAAYFSKVISESFQDLRISGANVGPAIKVYSPTMFLLLTAGNYTSIVMG
jgi:hypothetical protein